MTMIALLNNNGPNYLREDDIVSISAPFQKGKLPEARIIMLRGGHRVYIHNDEGNRLKLAHLIPPDAPMLASKVKVKPKAGKPRKAKPETTYSEASDG
jgi:hypothetical protein